MANTELTQQETAMMKEILHSYLSDLRLEIADTEKKIFRRELQRPRGVR